MAKKNNKEVTTTELAEMMASSFKWMDEKFDRRFDTVDKKIDGIDKRLDSMEVRLDRIENLLLRDHLNRIERLEDSMLQVKKKIGV